MSQALLEAGALLLATTWTLLVLWLARVIVRRMKAGTARDVALEVLAAADTSVRYVAQSVRPKLEAATVDTQITAEELEDVIATANEAMKKAAVDALRDQLSKHALRELAQNSESVDGVLGRAVEAAVHKSKTGGITP